MAIPTEVKILLEAAMTQAANQVNETAKERDFSNWASEMLLKKAEAILVGMIDLEIFKDEDRLTGVFACSMMMRTVRESIKSLQSQNFGGSSSEPQHQQDIVANSEGSKFVKAENRTNPAAAEASKNYIKDVVKSNSQLLTAYCQAHFGDSAKSQKSSPGNSQQKEVPKDAPMEQPPAQSASDVAIDEKSADTVPTSATQADNTVYIERSSINQYTTLSSHQLPKYGETENTDIPYLADGITFEDRDDDVALAMPTIEKTDDSKAKKKKNKKKKKKKTITEYATEEIVPASMAAHLQPIPLPGYPLSDSSTRPHGSESCVDIVKRIMQDVDLGRRTSQLTAPDPLFFDKDAHQELQYQKTIEELKAEHHKSLADLTRKYEAIKFENRNLKTDRNRELERLRKEHSSLDEAASNQTEELQRSISRIDTLESELSEKCELLEDHSEAIKRLRAQLNGHSDELKAIMNYRPNLEAHMAIFEAKKTSMAIEGNHAEAFASKRHKYHSKEPASTTPKGIANNLLLSNEGMKICAMMEDLQKDNAELRARCEWYSDSIESFSWKLTESVSEFQSRAEAAEDKLKEVEAGWDREKEWEKKRVLFEIGVAVRKRFFEQSKSILPHRQAQEGPDHRIIKQGNEACHRGDAIADAALFELGLLSGADNIIAYQDLYLCELHRIRTFPQEVTEALGYWASISTVEATAASEIHRVEASECFGSIINLWNDSPTVEEFKARFVGVSSLLNLRQLSRSIVNIDRGGKYRGYVEEKVDLGDANNLEESDETWWA
ncbi:hypothetical protein MFRU_012g00300 [Monilinia fructicola]|nr:hypothetical protein MFRU_012g00300 [Monilinia fructicola]